MRIGVLGAGRVGSLIGIELSAGGLPVTLVGRHLHARFLRAVTATGRSVEPRHDLVVSTLPAALRDVDVCLVTVRSHDTPAAAEDLRGALRADAVVVSFQNGLHNASRLRARLRAPVVEGVVSTNVVRQSGSVVRQAGRGALYAGVLRGEGGRRLRAMQRAFHRVGQPLRLRRNIAEVVAGKLLLNLNNGVCAATGMETAASIHDPDARWAFAACLGEGLDVLRVPGRRPARVTGVPPQVLLRLLSAPDAVLRMALSRLPWVPRDGRPSTLQDLELGRKTEIDEFNGEIVRRARVLGRSAPANATVLESVHTLERAVARGQTPRFLSSSDLRQRIEGRRDKVRRDGGSFAGERIRHVEGIERRRAAWANVP